MKFKHKKTAREYADEKQAEDIERRKAIAAGDNEASYEDEEGK